MNRARRKTPSNAATFRANMTRSYRPVREGFADLKDPPKTEQPALPEEDALKVMADLFKFNASAGRIEEMIKSGSMPGHAKPERCQKSVDGKPCGLASRKTDAKGRCAFHSNVDKFRALGLGENDIYDGSPQEAALAERASALKP